MSTEEKMKLVKHWLEYLESPDNMPSKWEHDFIDSIREQVENGRFLSEAQFNKLKEVYERLL